MKIVRATICLVSLTVIAACGEEPPPISVGELMENPRLLEATMVRCAQNRTEMKYEPECVNARDAVNRVQRAEEQERRAAMEEQSERKRQALRKTQEAAAAARRRAEDERRRQEEAEYLGIFEEIPADNGSAEMNQPTGAYAAPAATSNAPAVAVEAGTQTPEEIGQEDELPPGTDLEAVREELRRRQQSQE